MRRAGFGARPDELDMYGSMSVSQAIDTLLNYDLVADDVDGKIFQPGYVGVVTNKAGDPRIGEGRGIQKQVLQPGIYFLNPEEKRIDIVSIG